MHVGITRNALLLLKSHLTDPTQRFEVNGSISRESSVKCGVPIGIKGVYIRAIVLFIIH